MSMEVQYSIYIGLIDLDTLFSQNFSDFVIGDVEFHQRGSAEGRWTHDG